MAPKKAKRRVAGKAAATPSMVQLLLNGQATGEVNPGTRSISDVAGEIARNNNLKSYSILVNGTKVSAADAGKALAGAKTLEVFAKETRG
jgi:hypothetical protein